MPPTLPILSPTPNEATIGGIPCDGPLPDPPPMIPAALVEALVVLVLEQCAIRMPQSPHQQQEAA